MQDCEQDEAELLHIALADYMLSSKVDPVEWLEGLDLSRKAAGAWRRACLSGEWDRCLPLYLWITVKEV